MGFTVCWPLGTGLVVLYKAEELLESLDFSKIQDNLSSYVTAYGVGLAVYLLITCVVYWRRYEYAKRGMKVYTAKLRRLEKRYELQGKPDREVEGYDGSVSVQGEVEIILWQI